MKNMIHSLVEQGKYVEARSKIINLNVADIAQLLEETKQKKLLILFRMLPKGMAFGVFAHMSSDLQRHIIESVTDMEAIGIFDVLSLDDAIDIIEEMPANIVKKVLKNANDETRKLINQFLNYPEDSAGSIMTIEHVELRKEITVKQALASIKETGVDKETIDSCYVTDNNRILEGVVTIRKLILSDDQTVVKDIMDKGVIFINTHDDQEDVAGMFKKYDYYVMPVVDNEHRLVGIVTIDDVIDVIDQEVTEDLQKMAAMQPSEKAYLKTSTLQLAKHRLPWLLILMISAAFTGGIIKRYESALQSVMVLASFIPMIMDTGGNAGSQSSTLIIRGLALGDMRTNDILKVLWKELRVSCIVGLTLSSVNFIRIYLIEKTGLLVSVTVCFTLLLTVMLAKVVGGILPIMAKKIKLDPAIMAGPLITTIVDAVALTIYFTTAAWLLGI